ncbi:6-phosphogluconate dehydrogenase [Hylemonella gracilis str. Niagara R]|uniref:6-phosphogluconate dehydrogenase n=1 Tax=Hylemonella gracilis str. Niagara R TaxID=1458275 RepID=A0A016XHG4_9BURK|nr:NAD(P)-dependent oxidoreductase [Hylemonella gracilis]EYC51296.1 6-phosphogluconate dehydrogenase [Hylemonella gracilis str. Niagara R]
MSTTIGFIGLGMMGHGMAKNLLKKGYGLRFMAHRSRDNLDDLLAAGAVEVGSRAELARGASAVIVCVTGSPQVEQIVLGDGGLLAAAEPGLMVIDCSTAEPASTARLREAFAQRGAIYIDAPLARTPKEAEEGRLNTMVGAFPADFEKVRPILSAFCENVIHVGPPGHGHVLKLINNMLAMTTAAAIAEAMATAAKSGLSLQKLFDVVSAGGVNSGIFQMMVGKALQGDLGGLKFAIANGQKDLRYYTHLTETLPTTSFLAEAAHQSFVQASNLGLGEQFIASLLVAQEKLNGVTIVNTPSKRS